MATAAPLREIAEQLYGTVPEQFTAARDAAGRAARERGDRELAAAVKQLKRPSAAAWLANILARERGADIDALLALGTELREAQDALDGAALRTMTHQRQQVIRGLSATARELAGKQVGDSAVRELEATLDAALADEAAAHAVRSGRLVRGLSSTGLEPVDLDGAVALPGEVPPSRPRTPRAASSKTAKTAKTASTTAPTELRHAEAEQARADQARKAAAAELARAEQELERSEQRLSADETALQQARSTVQDIDAEIADLQSRLDDAGTRRAHAEQARRDADQARKAASRARDAARRTVETARRPRSR